MYYIVFCVIAILIISAVIGLWRGLFKTLFGLVALVLSLVISYYACPYVADYLSKTTEIDDYIEEKIYDRIEASIKSSVKESLENAGVTTDLEKLTKKETETLLTTEPDKATQIQLIDDFDLPESIRNVLIENNNDSTYESLGADGFYRYVSAYAAKLIVTAVTFIILFVIIRLVFVIIRLLLSRLINGIPVIAGVDKIGGMIFGLCAGIFIVWIFMIAASLFFGNSYDGMIAESQILTKIDETNILMKVIIGS